MHKAVAIIGMNFGDEGKGHITNYFCDEDTLNIRFNGGCQAAHAVFLSDGRHHIFKHFGAGTLSKARTLLSNHVILNPIVITAELAELMNKSAPREVFIDPRCRVTVPYDMLINEFKSWYMKKTDTTGFGINETVERSQFKQLRITARDLIDKPKKDLSDILIKIKEEYVPYRLDQLKLPESVFKKWWPDDIVGIEEAFLFTIEAMLKFMIVWPDDNLIDRYLEKDSNRKIVFEGAQGLRLDQNRTGLMPYLTRSNTGLQNIFECLRTSKTQFDMDVYLVTRTYLTRHGEGPLWNEIVKPYENVIDMTNCKNPYQGELRFGYLNKTWYDTALNETQDYIDKHKPKNIKNISLKVAMTHLDQIDDDEIVYSEDTKPNQFIFGDIDSFQDVAIVSKGNTEADISEIKN